MQTTAPLIFTFPILFTFPPQLRFPSTSRFSYASMRSRTEKSPEKDTDAIDLTDPSTSMGPRSDSESSDLIDFFFLTDPEPELLPPPVVATAVEDEPIIMGSSKVMMCSYSYMVVAVAVMASSSAPVVVVVMEGEGEGAAVDIVVGVGGAGEGEEATVQVVVVVVGVDVVAGEVDVEADASSVVSTRGEGGWVLPLFMFFVKGKKVAATALGDCLIRVRRSRAAWQSCFVQQPLTDVESEERSRA